MTRAWLLIFACITTAITLWTLSMTAHSAEPTTAEWAARALAVCPHPHATDAQLAEVAHAVARVAPERRDAALLLAIGCQETHYHERVLSGACKPWECDHGRAVGAWQVHRLSYVRDLWSVGASIDAQAEMAARVLAHAHGCPEAPWPANVMRAYRGGCYPLRDEQERLYVWRRMAGVR